jgi:hypothetical protein
VWARVNSSLFICDCVLQLYISYCEGQLDSTSETSNILITTLQVQIHEMIN